MLKNIEQKQGIVTQTKSKINCDEPIFETKPRWLLAWCALLLLSNSASYANPVVNNIASGNISIQQTATTTTIKPVRALL